MASRDPCGEWVSRELDWLLEPFVTHHHILGNNGCFRDLSKAKYLKECQFCWLQKLHEPIKWNIYQCVGPGCTSRGRPPNGAPEPSIPAGTSRSRAKLRALRPFAAVCMHCSLRVRLYLCKRVPGTICGPRHHLRYCRVHYYTFSHIYFVSCKVVQWMAIRQSGTFTVERCWCSWCWIFSLVHNFKHKLKRFSVEYKPPIFTARKASEGNL